MPTITNKGSRKWNLARRDVRPGETTSFTAEELALVEQLSPAALVAMKSGELVLAADPAPAPVEEPSPVTAEAPKPAPAEGAKAKEPKR